MSQQALTVPPQVVIDPKIVESLVLRGDIAGLTPQQKVTYYNHLCAACGLDPAFRPFEYLSLQGKQVLYAKKECSEQLRRIHGVSVRIVARELHEGVYVVTARALLPSGREDESTGAIAIDHLKGEARANAMMKAETKAKRRVTLSICGLGMLDETEVETIPGAKVLDAEIVEASAKMNAERPAVDFAKRAAKPVYAKDTTPMTAGENAAIEAEVLGAPDFDAPPPDLDGPRGERPGNGRPDPQKLTLAVEEAAADVQKLEALWPQIERMPPGIEREDIAGAWLIRRFALVRRGQDKDYGATAKRAKDTDLWRGEKNVEKRAMLAAAARAAKAESEQQ